MQHRVERTRIERLVRLERKQARTDRLVERLAHRHTRVEQGWPPGPPSRGAPARATAPQTPGLGTTLPLPVVVRQAAAAPERQPSPALSSTASARPEGPERAPSAWDAAQLTRLTDQVLRAIDQRVIAQRERLGRT